MKLIASDGEFACQFFIASFESAQRADFTVFLYFFSDMENSTKIKKSEKMHRLSTSSGGISHFSRLDNFIISSPIIVQFMNQEYPSFYFTQSFPLKHEIHQISGTCKFSIGAY